MICWLNGAFENIGQARIDPQDRGFLLGDGIFETVLAVDGVVRHGARHLARLQDGAKLLNIPVPFSDRDILAAMGRLLQDNGLLPGRVALRVTLSRGVGARGVAPPLDASPTLLLTSVFVPAAPANIRAVISSYVRNEKSISSRIKSLNYMDNIMARNEAAQRGADEALMFNSAGNIAAASAANLFVVADGELCTPSVEDGALPGIMRAIVMESAVALNIPVREGPIARDALPAASEAFLTNALIGVCPLIEIDGRPVGSGAIGPVTSKLRG